jgi:rubrerythrin
MDILNALDEIEKLEQKLAELYAYFHELFIADKTVSAVFFKMALEEKGHAVLVQYQRRTVRKNLTLCKEVTIDVEEINRIISDADAIIKAVPATSMDNALKAALQFEQSAAEHHYKTAMEQANPELAALLKNLAGVDKDHFDSLKNLAESRNISSKE